jgi:hypothetical protein
MRTPKRLRGLDWRQAMARMREEFVNRSAGVDADPDAARRQARHAELEHDLFNLDLAHRLLARACDPRRCQQHRCRRVGRCRQLLKIKRPCDICRSAIARERAADAGPAREDVAKGQRNH